MNRILSFVALFVLAFSAVAAETLIKPVPAPDLTRLSKEAGSQLVEARREFESAKAGLVGDGLAEAFAKLGAIHARYGQLDVARVALDNAIALAPTDGRFHYLQGVFAVQAGRDADARTLFARALALDQTYLPIRYRLAEVQVRLKDFAGAKQTLQETAVKRVDLAPAPALLGEIALREKRYPDAIRLLEQSLKADPGATSLYPSLAAAYDASGDKTRAQAARAKAGGGIAVFGDPLVQGIYASAPTDPVSRALALAGQRQHANARALLDAELKTRPNDATLLATYARIEADGGNLSAAKTRADAALRATPNGALAELAQGIVLEMSGQDAQAVPHYERAVRADLKLGEARLLLGNAYMRSRNFAAAAEQYRQFAQIAPSDDGAWMRLAAAQSQAGRCNEGLLAVNDALTSRPKDGGLLQAFVRLASSCPAATPVERQKALDYARSLYNQRPDAAHAETYAMALAANGKAQDAVDYEAQAIFEAVKRNDQAAVTRGQSFLKRFETKQAAITPWPAGHPLLAPPRLQPSVAATR